MMKIAGIRELRAKSAALLGGGEPILITRHGKVSGVFLPLENSDRVPDDLRRELALVLGQHLHFLVESRGVTEDEIQADFDAHRKRRRRR